MSEEKCFYIGNQKILQEKDLGENIVEVELVSTQERVPSGGEAVFETCPGLGESEIVCYNKADLERIKTPEPDNDATGLRQMECGGAVASIVLALMNHCVKITNMDFVWTSALETIQRSNAINSRKFLGKHEGNRTIHDLKDELMG